ncbi:cob(I)yrinic acid a,c-diamide adenosyltransferase [Methylotenera sp.]|uniref:cob(I)yrinic acid a,c-diamide adenosyltransferase n=1 Tax=Methylotenera sp. TaxID=2051956 RepID=UPI002489B272|nr:cob(I)yrinic acid a,c-diamide adenosyltransferase [Methylotenera sp.]MDI1298647.1 cob(I)yrinic acid a,c-diamide adenosyltransferase [Methylotenera sp.]
MTTPENKPKLANERHLARMQRKKAIVDASIDAAQISRGLLLINTGTGKGKSTAAFGLLARSLGHGMKAVVIQFIKGRSDTGEEAFFRNAENLTWHVMGDGFTWETQDAERDKQSARAAWQMVCNYLQDETIDLIILDEFTYALKYQWLTIEEVTEALESRPLMQHVVITGRAAPDALIAIADTVSEINLVKHAFKGGVQAMPGIEW